VSDNSRAYNSVWQLRTDAWCRLEEASDRPTKPTTNGELKEEYRQVDRQFPLDQRHGGLLRRVHGRNLRHCGGLDSLLEPTGPLRDAQKLAAEAYGSRHTYFVTNGTSTANKIVTQSLVAPGDIVLLDRNCHQSHHYGMMLAGAEVIYLEAYPLPAYSMYGAVPLREIKSKLLALKRAGKLDRVKMMSLTNCTFDGVVYDVQRVMEECLAIKPDLVFLWDEAWFAFARFHPVYRNRIAMTAAKLLRDKLGDNEYKREFETRLAADNQPTDGELLERRLVPDPAKARVRVYATQSTHKTLTSLRQGSMIHVYDQDFDQKVPSRSTRPTWPTRRRRRTTRSSHRWISAAGRSRWKVSSWCSARSRTPCSCATRSTTIPC
jgi:Orn/Lys/Arg decarboxylase, major domain